jgi:hypothetical protein
MTIKELPFGEGYANTHMEVSIPNAMPVSSAVQSSK